MFSGLLTHSSNSSTEESYLFQMQIWLHSSSKPHSKPSNFLGNPMDEELDRLQSTGSQSQTWFSDWTATKKLAIAPTAHKNNLSYKPLCSQVNHSNLKLSSSYTSPYPRHNRLYSIPECPCALPLLDFNTDSASLWNALSLVSTLHWHTCAQFKLFLLWLL